MYILYSILKKCLACAVASSYSATFDLDWVIPYAGPAELCVAPGMIFRIMISWISLYLIAQLILIHLEFYLLQETLSILTIKKITMLKQLQKKPLMDASSETISLWMDPLLGPHQMRKAWLMSSVEFLFIVNLEIRR